MEKIGKIGDISNDIVERSIFFIKEKLDEIIDHENELIDFIQAELDRAREEENKRCVDIINRIIQTSGEDSSNQWFDGLRSARESIKLTTK